MTWQQSEWLDWKIDKEISEGKSLFIGVVGRSQMGKSTLALQEMIKHDPKFSWDRVTFNAEKFLDQIMLTPPEGSHFLIDDAGLQMPADQWWDMNSQIFMFAAQSLGMYHWVIWITVPDQEDIVKRVRGKFDILITVDSNIKGLAKIQLPKRSGNLTHPNLLFPYPVYYDGKVRQKITKISYGPLPDLIFNFYHKLKVNGIMAHWQSYKDKYAALRKKQEARANKDSGELENRGSNTKSKGNLIPGYHKGKKKGFDISITDKKRKE